MRIVGLSADDWCLYQISERNDAAEALNEVLSDALERNQTLESFMANEVSGIFSTMERWQKLGAADTEPRAVASQVVCAYYLRDYTSLDWFPRMH